MNRLKETAIALAVGAAVAVVGNEAVNLLESSAADKNAGVFHCAESLGSVATLSQVVPAACNDYKDIFGSNGLYALPSASDFKQSRLVTQKQVDADKLPLQIMVDALSVMAAGGYYVLTFARQSRSQSLVSRLHTLPE